MLKLRRYPPKKSSRAILRRINYARPQETEKEKHIKDNNCSGLTVEMLLLKVIKSGQNGLRLFNPLCTRQVRAGG